MFRLQISAASHDKRITMPIWSSNSSIRPPLLVLGAVELLGVYSSVLCTAVVFYGSVSQGDTEVGSLYLKAAIVAIVVLTSLISMGLYNFHQRLYFREVLARVTVGLFVAALVLAATYFVFPFVSLPRYFITVAILMALVVTLLVRLYFFHNVDTNVFRRRTLVYGAGERARSISDLRRLADRRGFHIVGSVPANGDREVFLGNGKLFRDKLLVSIAKEHAIDEIVIAMDDRRGNLPLRDLLDCKLKGVNVIDIIEFLERESKKVRIDLVNPGWLIFAPGFRATRIRIIGKKLVDFLLSFTALLVLWPVMLLVAIAIKCGDGITAPVFYRQTRVGQFGKEFSILKFRSMRPDAESKSGAVWAEENDPRITRVGRFLRSSRLDELPQLINVVRGDMSLVGPRPERPEFVEKLAESIPYYLERHTAKPGITGWAQLRYSYGASEEDTIQKLQYDLYYVKNQSLLMDMTIMLQTVEVVIWGKGVR